jgi:hypothetical protein
MSRAFVKEDDDAVEDVADRPISTAPNLVTAEGLAAIEAEVARLDKALADARRGSLGAHPHNPRPALLDLAAEHGAIGGKTRGLQRGALRLRRDSRAR